MFCVCYTCWVPLGEEEIVLKFNMTRTIVLVSENGVCD